MIAGDVMQICERVGVKGECKCYYSMMANVTAMMTNAIQPQKIISARILIEVGRRTHFSCRFAFSSSVIGRSAFMPCITSKYS